MPIRRTESNARRVVTPALWLLFICALLAAGRHGPDLVGSLELGTLGRILLGVALAALFLSFGRITGTGPSLSKWLARKAVKNDVLWPLAAAVLTVFRPLGWVLARCRGGIRALAARVTRTRAFGFILRHRRMIAIGLVALTAYRLGAAIVLIDLGADATVLQWLFLGVCYALFGATAPIVAVMLAARKGEGVLVTAIIWLLLGIIGTVPAHLYVWYAHAPELRLLSYPLLAVLMALGELLLQFAVLALLGGSAAKHYTGNGGARPGSSPSPPNT